MWDPGTYLAYADLRGRPFFDLTARIGAESPRRVVDLGCGPGNLTLRLTERWPAARVEALDGSAEMVAAAQEAGLTARVADVREWSPEPETDVVVCNAVLHWVPEHVELLDRWVTELPSGAWLAVQMPGNFRAPSHRAVRELLASAEWADLLGGVSLPGEDAVREPVAYAEQLAARGCFVEAWETTYAQRLSGQRPVLDWVSGSTLRPVRAALAEADWARFQEQLAARLATAYPVSADGSTWFPFRRVFVVARTP
ncbi:trans-aconitate 2-methyltransferase [Tamaricihabitans halophyticus]|uniref:Trans-aconitate 2-methyltransferase n=1 Tax=Tamaricihabitans halophyticus TaxID=1262583 RepID=A0A4R2QZ13_9PSEU|nr:trans-aconitate 2-methyltransferase [Tamaricihabitans halophyticus]TCP54927.1 trans-aconitate 2-methyltransferase [Tamaricihabitans halophyticus]